MYYTGIFMFLFFLSYCIHVSVSTSTNQFAGNLTKHVQIGNNTLSDKVPTKIPLSSVETKSFDTVPIEGGGGSFIIQNKPVTEKNETRKISARKGVVFKESDSTNKTTSLPTSSTAIVQHIPAVHEVTTSKPSTSTTKPTKIHLITSAPKKKPSFTMVTGDRVTLDSESFIESPTTGKDYVLPIVLIILALPILLFIIKLIYKRGTEFTERQQYHRMYLIDGMYNTR